jgi:DNA-binding ferritin-like protein
MTMNIDSTVNFFLGLLSQIKVYHWQTIGKGSHAQHVAFGKFYDDVNDIFDEFVEQAMGKYGRFQLNQESNTFELMNYNDTDLEKFIDSLRNVLVNMSKEYDVTDTNLMNLRDEILGEVEKLNYLLTLE